MGFRPREVLFSPTTACNLKCPHCDTVQSGTVLSKAACERFLDDCNTYGIKRIGFTGGEPCLAGDFLRALVKRAVAKKMYFNRIMTNGVWYNSSGELERTLAKLHNAGYDGSLCVSVDAFHKQDLKKTARFIQSALSIWKRSDALSIACVVGTSCDTDTEKILRRLSRLLGGRPEGFKGRHPRIRGGSLFIKILKINLSAVGKASVLKDGWDGRWFKEDGCAGPGNVLLVLPDGSVKPCCGYASDSKRLTIGNIKRDSVKTMITNSGRDPFIRTVFGQGLTTIRKRLEASGVRFPGKTSDNCFFCHYVLTKVPKDMCERSLG